MSENGNRQVQITAQGVCDGFPVKVQFDVQLHHLPAALARLRQYGVAPAAVDWQRTPEGAPICPVHGVVMQRREKQGDVWHSHKVVDAQGHERYCRGYRHGHPDEDGYLI